MLVTYVALNELTPDESMLMIVKTNHKADLVQTNQNVESVFVKNHVNLFRLVEIWAGMFTKVCYF